MYQKIDFIKTQFNSLSLNNNSSSLGNFFIVKIMIENWAFCNIVYLSISRL